MNVLMKMKCTKRKKKRKILNVSSTIKLLIIF